MNYYDALKIFNVDSGDKINKVDIKKMYRKLVKKWHPDVCGDDYKYKEIQDAHAVILTYLSEVAKIVDETKEEKSRTLIIGLKDIMDIFKGKKVRVSNNVILSKNNIGGYKIFVKLNVDITVNGVTFNFNTIKPRNIKDEYTFDIAIPDMDLEKSLDVSVKLLDKTIEKEMPGILMNFRFNLDYISQVTIALQRVEVDKG